MTHSAWAWSSVYGWVWLPSATESSYISDYRHKSLETLGKDKGDNLSIVMVAAADLTAVITAMQHAALENAPIAPVMLTELTQIRDRLRAWK